MSALKTKFLYQSLFAITQLLFPLLTYPYIAKTLGVSGLGTIAFIEYSTGFIITLAGLGIPYYGVREIQRSRGAETFLVSHPAFLFEWQPVDVHNNHQTPATS